MMRQKLKNLLVVFFLCFFALSFENGSAQEQVLRPQAQRKLSRLRCLSLMSLKERLLM